MNSRHRTVIVVQARMGSTRLPQKMLMDLNGHRIIDWVAIRANKSKLAEQVVFAIPNSSRDDILAEHLTSQGLDVVRGSEDDVLSRYCKAAEAYDADIIVRVCADNPMVSGECIDCLIRHFTSLGSYDYVYNHIPVGNSFPNGFGAEVVSRDILSFLNSRARQNEHREHIFNYIWENKESFRIGTLSPIDLRMRVPHIRLDVDTIEDLEWLRRLALNPDDSDYAIIKAALEFPKPNGY